MTDRHNESLSENIHRPSLKQKIVGNIVVGGAFVLPVAVTGAAIFFGMKQSRMQLETARLSLQAAKIASGK